VCGIAGIVAPGRPSASLSQEITRMTLAMPHRGPDGMGSFVAEGVAFGHTRLAIIDLKATGRQPMTNEAETLQMVVNGEIYNYRQIRTDLQARGHTFRSTCDSEVILHLYEEYGDECLSRLEGMFALALWDAPARRLLLARDRFGIKPLYFARRGDSIYFASELTALVRSGTIPVDLDPEALYAYMAFSYVPAPLSILRGVEKLLPAEQAVWIDGQVERRTYWSPRRVTVPGRRTDAVATLESLLEASVQAHLVADVPVAAFLSGGVDSSTVVALAQRRQKMQTFCVAFPDADLDEAPVARRVADHLGTQHQEVSLRPDPMELLLQAVAYMDEPFADSSALPTFAVCQAARQVAKVVLSGDGGDEVFGGYTGRYRVAALQAALPFPGRLAGWLRRLPPWRSGRRRSLPEMLELAALTDADRFVVERQITSDSDRARLFGEGRAAVGEQQLREIPAAAIRQSRQWHPVHRALWMDLTTSLSDDMLTKVDRMSMAHGLEVRVPMLDHRVVEFALSLPAHWLVSPWPMEGKRLLRSVAAPLLPPDILQGPKRGFVVPLNRWLQERFLTVFDDASLGPGSELANWMDRRAIAALRSTPVTQRPREDLYALLVLMLWLRRVRSLSGSA
jgi:asparagine synthase (glutamine-hydrolysing)